MDVRKSIPIMYIRGGTSKGAFILASDLPTEQQSRDQALLAIYGSPDIRQIDGIGGADPLTSKVAIIEKSKRPGVDIDYTFGQVSIDSPMVDYQSNCGNMSAGVGLFAVEKGLIDTVEPITNVRIYNTNTQKVIESQIPVKDGQIDSGIGPKPKGLPSTGILVILNFLDSGGSKTNKVLPTGNVRDEILLPDGKVIEVTCVDAATPAVFVQARDINLTGTELPLELEKNVQQLERLEYIRQQGAVLMGLVDKDASLAQLSPAIPKVIVVSPPQNYQTIDGSLIIKDDIHLVGRAMAMKKMHKAYAVTGGICTSVAALIGGSVVNEFMENQQDLHTITIGHPSGTVRFQVAIHRDQNKEMLITEAKVERTARVIMEGTVFLP